MIRATLKSIYVVLGIISLVLGIVGAFLPLLPTTPFVLLSVFLFERGSKRMHNWVMSNKILGRIVLDWKLYRVISMRSKVTASIMILASIIYLSFKRSDYPILLILAFTPMICSMIFIWRQKTKKEPTIDDNKLIGESFDTPNAA